MSRHSKYCQCRKFLSTKLICQFDKFLSFQLYAPLNIYIALVGVVIWTERDEINLHKRASRTLENFKIYRQRKLNRYHINDNAQLLTKVEFDEGIVGKLLEH